MIGGPDQGLIFSEKSLESDKEGRNCSDLKLFSDGEF